MFRLFKFILQSLCYSNLHKKKKKRISIKRISRHLLQISDQNFYSMHVRLSMYALLPMVYPVTNYHITFWNRLKYERKISWKTYTK